jgi:hypothetical protein
MILDSKMAPLHELAMRGCGFRADSWLSHDRHLPYYPEMHSAHAAPQYWTQDSENQDYVPEVTFP